MNLRVSPGGGHLWVYAMYAYEIKSPLSPSSLSQITGHASHGGHCGQNGRRHEVPKKSMADVARLVRAIGRHRSHKPNPSATTILPVHWADPADLTEEDPCRSANDPAVWIGDCCHTVGIWTMCPGTAVPEEKWAGALLHAMQARLMANLLSQRAVPLHRTQRGHVFTQDVRCLLA